MTEKGDRATVGLSDEGQRAMDAVMAQKLFEQEMDAYRFAVAFSLREGLVQDQERLAGARTKFNVGGIDRDGRLRRLMDLFAEVEGDNTYAVAERHADAGIRVLKIRLVDEQQTLIDVVDPERVTETDPGLESE